MEDNVKARVNALKREDASLIGDGGVSREANERIKARVFEKAGLKNNIYKENLFMKKLKNYQKALVWAACFCLVVGATFGVLGLAGAFDSAKPIDNPGIIGTAKGLNMIKTSVSYDAEGTKYTYYVSLGMNDDINAVADSFRAAGMSAEIVADGEGQAILVNCTREQLLSYEAPADVLMLFSTSLSDNENSDRRY